VSAMPSKSEVVTEGLGAKDRWWNAAQQAQLGNIHYATNMTMGAVS
jgi:hypothetical protein